MARNTYMQDEHLKEEFNSKQLFRIMRYMIPHKSTFIGICIMLIAATFLGLVTPLLNNIIVDNIIPNKNFGILIYVLVALTTLNILDILFQYLQGKYMGILGHKIIYQVRRDVFIRMQALSFDYFDNRPAGKIIVRVTAYVDELANFFANVMISFVMNIFRMVVVMMFMFALNWLLALVVLAAIIPLFLFIFILRKYLKKRFTVSRNKGSNRTAYIHENIMGNLITKEYNRTKQNGEIYEEVATDCTDAWCAAIRLNELFVPGIETCWYYGNLALYAVSFFAIMFSPVTYGITIGTVIAFSSYMSMFNGPLNQLAVIFQQLAQISSNLERIFDLIDTDPIIEDSLSAIPIPEIDGRVNFDNVTFGYDSNKIILENFNLDVPAGKSIALVGPTGAGKSTVVNLISRFYDVQDGSVQIDGHNVKDVTLHSLRSQMGVMMQDTFIFKGNIMENIRYGNPKASDAEVVAAAKKVFANEIIEKMSQGYNTNVNGLSTGEKQLISFARVMLSNPKILILDEATSSIDTETEEKIQKAMSALLAGRTSFMIAHRLSTIRKADCILYIANKGIMEAGTHDELMKKKGLYYELNTKQ